jgi:hypothetical protein
MKHQSYTMRKVSGSPRSPRYWKRAAHRPTSSSRTTRGAIVACARSSCAPLLRCNTATCNSVCLSCNSARHHYAHLATLHVALNDNAVLHNHSAPKVSLPKRGAAILRCSRPVQHPPRRALGQTNRRQNKKKLKLKCYQRCQEGPPVRATLRCCM